MPDNVISLAQHFRPKTNAVGDLAYGFASARRDDSDVYWLKENSELLSILECTNQTVSAQDLECYSAFYRSLPDRIAFFPQYYRFLTSIALDLEALGFDGSVAAQLCAFVDRHALPETELSDLQRAEAQRLLARRGYSHGNDAALRARLHSFMDQSRAFAVPNRKMAYELTHIVFYLSEYGRRDPELSAQAVQSLMYTGILAHLEENADLLSEVCVALRYAGQIPPAAWEQWIATVLRGFDRKPFLQAGHFLECPRLDDKPLTIQKALIIRTNNETRYAVVNKRNTQTDDHQNDGFRFFLPVEPIDRTVSAQEQQDSKPNGKGQGQQGGGQRPQRYPPALEQPRDEDSGHRPHRHGIPMGKVGEPQDAVNQRDPQRTKGELRAIGDAGDQNIVRECDDCV